MDDLDTSTPGSAPTLPEDLDQAIAQAQVATQAAIAAGLRRIQVEIAIPELKVQPVVEQFIQAFADYGSRLRLYFPDAGSAALARRDWGDVPYQIRGISDLRSELQDDESLIIFVEPSDVEVLEVEKLCQQAGDRPVILLNPCLESIAVVGIGYAARQLRDRFLSQWESCYFVRPMEGSALFRAFPGPWELWVEQDEIYQKVGESPTKPDAEMMDAMLNPPSATTPASPTQRLPKPEGVLKSLQQFLKALSS